MCQKLTLIRQMSANLIRYIVTETSVVGSSADPVGLKEKTPALFGNQNQHFIVLKYFLLAPHIMIQLKLFQHALLCKSIV